MSSGFAPSPEKERVQNTLWIPAIRDVHRRLGRIPLRVLTLPGRRCAMLIKLLSRRYTRLADVTCVERSAAEALLIRGRLEEHGESSGRVPIDLFQGSLYEYLTLPDRRAVARRFQVVDIDAYGHLEDESGEVLRSTQAAIDVQARADVSEWLLLLTTEAASARGSIIVGLTNAEERLKAEYEAVLHRTLPPSLLDDVSPPTRLIRYAACVGACIAHCAFPMFEAKVARPPFFYRGTDLYGQPGKRALMGAFPFLLRRPRAPLHGLGESARRAQCERLMNACVTKCAGAKAVISDSEGNTSATELGNLRFE